MLDPYKRGKGKTYQTGGRNAVGANLPKHSTGCRDKEAAWDHWKTVNKMTLEEFEVFMAAKKQKAAPKVVSISSKKSDPKGLTIAEARNQWLDSIPEDDPQKGSGKKGAYSRITLTEFLAPLNAQGVVYYNDLKKEHCVARMQHWEKRVDAKGKRLALDSINTYRRACVTMARWLCENRDEQVRRNPWHGVKALTEIALTAEQIDAGMQPNQRRVTQPIDSKGQANWSRIQARIIPFLKEYECKGLRPLIDHPENFKALTELLRRTGLRRGDAVKFVPDARLQPTRLGYKYTTVQGKGSKKSVTVFLSQELGDRLKALPGLPWKGRKDYANAGNFPFWDGSYKTFAGYLNSQLNAPLKALGEQLGMKDVLRPHRFRDSFAADKLNNGGTIEQVAKLLGHSGSNGHNVTRKHYNPDTLEGEELLEATLHAINSRVAAEEIAELSVN